MSYNFEDAAPVKVTGLGKKAEPNPFTDVIAAIALKTDKDGKPIAKGFTENHEADNDGTKRKTAINRIKRLMSEAGEKNDPAVTVRVHAEPVKDAEGKESATQVKVVFWTVKRQSRPRPAGATTQTASTDQSVAVAAPEAAKK